MAAAGRLLGEGSGVFLIIWGFRSRAKNMAMTQLACRQGHVAAHRLVKVTRWFTLFFIPLIPVSKKYFSICAACGLQLQVPKDAAEEMIARASGVPAPDSVDPVSAPVNPVLSPAAPAEPAVAQAGPPAGWYPDPTGAAGLRWWDGTRWTESVQPA
ncbi:MAG TPA: DUF2510 domain-containing protein [Acidimicrobiales bacterium]|nr:DUF2510 domain-containing protein [Acidimicrobiales bacterium]